ncbi:unnamed protein product [Effrenium voratum]|uniref:Uncharacterized protein n=1 Tax=Effrenium voratum TaxID=2562239 RepID=A0AA36JS02_9DINO|nr:unnamed protein product [Effrenium voratum]
MGVSHWYSSGVLERLAGSSPWAQVAAQRLACGELNASDCGESCEVSAGLCGPRRSWLARSLAAAQLDAKCGLLGQIMAQEAVCSESNASSCALRCAWDPRRDACGVAQHAVTGDLRQDFREELARVALRQQRCLQRSQEECTGSCTWTGTCTLKTLEALLAVIDEDCPLRTVLGVQAACGELVTSASCQAATDVRGLPACLWTGRCVPETAALELQLLAQAQLLTPQLEEVMSAAIGRCQNSSCDADVFCPEDLPLPSKSLRSAGSLALLVLAARI